MRCADDEALAVLALVRLRRGSKDGDADDDSAYNGAYGGGNFNGYARGQVDIVIPLHWTVTVNCANRGLGGRHSCAIVRSPGGKRPALAGASTPALVHGHAFSFQARRAAVYRIASLVPADLEQGALWDVLEVTPVRLPHVVLLRRFP